MQSYNPAIHRIKQALFHAAITSDLSKNPLPPPHPDLLKYFNPPEKVLKRSRDAVDECTKLFKIKPGLIPYTFYSTLIFIFVAPPKTTVKRRKDAHVPGEDDDELIDLGAPVSAREPIRHPSGNLTTQPNKSIVQDDGSATEEESDVEDMELERKVTHAEPSISKKPSSPEIEIDSETKEAMLPTPSGSPYPEVDRAPGRIIGNSHPLRDFRENIKQGDVVTEAVRDLSAVIKEVVTKPFASRRHKEMIECMGEMRRVALEEDEIDAWNKFGCFTPAAFLVL